MAVYYESDISGAGQAALVGGVKVQSVAVRLILVGPSVRSLDWPGVTDHLLRAGWFALGNFILIEADAVPRIYWRPEHYVNFVQNYYSPPSQFPADTAASERASHVRWFLAEGTTAHLVVAGA